MQCGGKNKGRFAVLSLALGVISQSLCATLYLDDGAAHVLDTVVNGSLYVDYEVPSSTGTSVSIMENGEVMDTIKAFGTSVVTLDGGNVWGGQYLSAIEAFDQSRIHLLAGTVNDLIVGLNDSVFTISGGTLNADLVIAAGEVGNYDRSSFTFAGSEFVLDGTVVPYGTYEAGEDNFREGSLSGTLEDGSPLSVSYTMYDGGKIVLVPETTAPPLLLLFVSFLSICLHKRKRLFPWKKELWI